MAKKKASQETHPRFRYLCDAAHRTTSGRRQDRRDYGRYGQDEGASILEYEIKEGQSIQFRVGGTVEAFMERVGPAPDGDMFLDADGSNTEAITIKYEHALSGSVTVTLQSGQSDLSINPVVSRRWVMTAPNWE